MPVLAVIALLWAVLIAFAVVHDVVMRRRGGYRPRAHWEEVSRRRREHFRRTRDERHRERR